MPRGRGCHLPHLTPRVIFLFLVVVVFILLTSYDYINLSISQHDMWIGFDVKLANRRKPFDIRNTITTGKTIHSEMQRRIENKNISSSLQLKEHYNETTQLSAIKNNSSFSITMAPTAGDWLPLCPEIPSSLQGKLQIKLEAPGLVDIELANKDVTAGGRFHPQKCTSRHKVAIIVPYRNRKDQLKLFLNHLHPILRRQDLDYGIYIINQGGENLFNRAMLFNVGFKEAMKDYNWTCCIFHDVDLLPEDDRNLYTCPSQPRHMSVAVDKFKYKLPYKRLFGGAGAISVKHFQQLNGFSNQFWGWGGEDDDMSKRIQYNGLKIIRYKPEIARYTMIKHKKEKANRERVKVLRTSHRRYKTDGLNNLQYKVVNIGREKLFTNVTVMLEPIAPIGKMGPPRIRAHPMAIAAGRFAKLKFVH